MQSQKIQQEFEINLEINDLLKKVMASFLSYRSIFRTMSNIRSSRQRCSVKIRVLKNFAKFTRKLLCQSLSLIKLQTLVLVMKNAKINVIFFITAPLFCLSKFSLARPIYSITYNLLDLMRSLPRRYSWLLNKWDVQD